MSMRTDQEIANDFAMSNASLEEEKHKNPMNYNLYLLGEILLNIRTYLKNIKEILEAQ